MSLSSDLSDVFAEMKTMNDKPAGWDPPKDAEGNILPIEQWDQNKWPIKLKDADRFMADGVAKAIRTSLETGKTMGSTYTGSCSLGTVSGTVTGTFTSLTATSNESAGADKIWDATQKMKDAGENSSNDDLWKGIVDCCSQIVSGAEIKEALTGTAIPPSAPYPPTVPAIGTGTGTLDDSAGTSALLSALQPIPSAMGSSGQDSIMSSAMAVAILAYFKTIIVNLEGDTTLSGIKAINVITGNQ